MNRRGLFAKKDLPVLGAIVLAAVSVMLFMRGGSQGTRAVLEVDGQVVAVRELAGLAAPEVLEAEGHGGVKLRVEFSAEGARVLYSTCPDNTCVRTGMLRHGGESAICLPGRAVLRLEAEGGSAAVDAETY